MKRGAYDYLTKDPDRGYLTMLPAVVDNVLARRHAEVALHATEERLRSILASQPDMIFEANLDGVLTFASRVAHEIIGLDADSLPGRRLDEFVVENDRERLADAFDTLRRPGHELRACSAGWSPRATATSGSSA